MGDIYLLMNSIRLMKAYLVSLLANQLAPPDNLHNLFLLGSEPT